jgi:acyl-CoA synthetase (AMP-forming)/AMP-acid ligase II
VPEPRTLPELLRHNRDAHGAKPAIVTADDVITHGDLDVQSRALAARFACAYIGKSSRVGIMLPNGIEWAVVVAALWRIGAVVVPLSTLLRPPELEAQLWIASVTHLVLTKEFRGRSYLDDVHTVAPRLPALRAVWCADDLPATVASDDVVRGLESAVRPADDFVVLFTSGSRGAPKGTLHTHGSALRAVAAGLEARGIGPDDRLYIPMPFFWTGGLASGLLSALVAGATLLTEAVPEPARTLALLTRERATLFRGWPDQAARLAAHPTFAAADLSSLGPGSLPAVLPPSERPAPGARANLFGMTETFGPYCGARLDRDLPPDKHGSCGQPFPGFEVRVVDPDSGAPVAPGTRGEICVRGPNVMRGLCGRTRDATFTPDGWYRTGDLGALDADGYLWYHGRLDDMFKVNGATVYPAEVEVALRAVAGVRQAHVTNVGRANGGDAVGALVVSDLPIGDVVDGARARLSAFKVPTCWMVTASADAVPMTPTAKVDKAALQALLAREGIGDDPRH